MRLKLLLFILISYLATSCVNTRRFVYFAGQKDETVVSNTVVPETIIEKNDLLGISVSSLNPEASAIFNAPNITYANTSSSSSGMVIQSSGYLVNSDGNIQFPIVGSVKAAGLTASQLREQLVKTLLTRKLLVDPIVSVRYLNFKVTVLGEVNRPSVINVPNEKISLLEAIGLAGDITLFGKKDNVMVIRESEGNKTIEHLDLTSSELFQSPYYYLKSNDIIYVEPTKGRVASSGRGNQLLPILLSGLSFAAIIIDRLTR